MAPSALSSLFRRNPLQAGAFCLCVLFGAAMILNIGFAGEATWFWYATLMHHGVPLYGAMHAPLQPLFALENDAWMTVAGHSVIACQTLAFLHVVIFCAGLVLLLRESDWPDWAKAILLLAAFIADIFFVAIRFDDFHIVNDIFFVYALIVLLRVLHAADLKQERLWSVVAGMIAGLGFTNRSTDGGMLIVGCALCLPFLARRHRWSSTLLYGCAVAVTIPAVVLLTGDSLHNWLNNSIFHAAAAKGGTGTVFRGPVLAIFQNLHLLTHDKRTLWPYGMIAAGYVAVRWFKASRRSVILIELAGFALVAATLAIHSSSKVLAHGGYISGLNASVQTALYPLCLWVLWRSVRSRTGGDRPWDRREILVIVPAAAMVSAAVSQATGSDNSTISLMMLFPLAGVLLPFDRIPRWRIDSLLAIALALSATGVIYKAITPYAWNTYAFAPMFTARQWYHHPLYGPMYAETNLLKFIEPVCAEIHDAGGKQELLTLPYSYPNYFCGIAPWHNEVQTWFDTTTPQAVADLMQQLDTAPPHFVLYQRQMEVLHAHETEYNGGRPIMHRKLDEMILRKLGSGQWKVVDQRRYLEGDGWYLIDTTSPAK